MQKLVELNRSEIIVGKPLPFGIYDAERKLLLAAKGQRVSDAMRERLRGGKLMAVVDEDGRGGSAETEARDEPVCQLTLLRQQLARATGGTRVGFKVSRDERSESHTSRVVGIGERRILMLTVPAMGDYQYVNINEGQIWLFRTFHATSAIRFTARIGKVILEPFPYFHIEVPSAIEMRSVRKMLRAPLCVTAVVELDEPREGVIIDLSSAGARLAMRKDHVLHDGQQLVLRFRLPVLDDAYDLIVKGTVVRSSDALDAAYPDLIFYGLRIEANSPSDRLVLHAYAQERLVHEFDVLSRLICD